MSLKISLYRYFEPYGLHGFVRHANTDDSTSFDIVKPAKVYAIIMVSSPITRQDALY